MANLTVHYPGATQHQALLQAVVAHYRNDPRVLAVIVFGSLGQGNWDAHSDLDLDVVIADSVKNAVQTLVTVKREGKWRVALFQNTPAQFHGRPELVQQLTEELRQLL